MMNRTFWMERIVAAWSRRWVIWLSGVRRAGKTYLCQSLTDIEYFDCELPRVRGMLDDPEGFLRPLQGRTVALDEIHRLRNPSEILKIAADHFPDIRIIATGSSTLGASAKFRDTLTGRRETLWLTPMVSPDLLDFGQTQLDRRFLFGGLPPFYLSNTLPERDFQDWVDSYWAKDIQELFRIERRHSFQQFFELLMSQSGGIFEASGFASPCEVSRTTINNYLATLEATYVVHIVRPFSTNKATEIISAPKVYGFDTGFICYYRGWHQLRSDDMGILWEHYVLNEIQGRLQMRDVKYWRDKRGHEIDFIIARRGETPIAIECKWSYLDFDPRNLKLFRHRYPQGDSYVVGADVHRVMDRQYEGLNVKFVGLNTLIESLKISKRD